MSMEDYNRLKNAMSLAHILWFRGVRSTDIQPPLMEDKLVVNTNPYLFWRGACDLARCKPNYKPSLPTRDAVKRILEEMETSQNVVTMHLNQLELQRSRLEDIKGKPLKTRRK